MELVKKFGKGGGVYLEELQGTVMRTSGDKHNHFQRRSKGPASSSQVDVIEMNKEEVATGSLVITRPG